MTRRQVAKSVSSTVPTTAMPAALTSPSSRPALPTASMTRCQSASEVTSSAMIHAGAAGEIGRDRNPAIAHDRFGNRRADAAGGAGDEDDLVAQAAHEKLPILT